MKRLLAISTALLLIISFFGIQSSANAFEPLDAACQGVPTSGEDASTVCAEKDSGSINPLSGNDGIILKIVRLVTFITGVASVIIIIFSGFKYVTANGDSNSVNSAKNTLLYAVVGLVISLLSQGIVLFVINRL